MTIQRIFIPCYSKDVRLAKISVASIRKWYPNIPITLLKDYYRGSFSTRNLELHWNVEARVLKQQYGSPFSKLEPLLDNRREKCLFLDADTIFVGKVLDIFSTRTEDFIVHYSPDPDNQVAKRYYDLELMTSQYPQFVYPSQCFNAGQFIGTTGIIRPEDLANIVDWKSRPVRPRADSPFILYEEAALNYLLPTLNAENRLQLGHQHFWYWSEDTLLTENRINSALSETSEPFIIHWAGATRSCISDMSHSNLLDEFRRSYYSKQPLGKLKYLAIKSKEKVRSFVSSLLSRRKTLLAHSSTSS
jgi:hypothetical protein